MNSYKQQYMTEFAYILGTMQKENKNIIDKFPSRITENQDGITVFNDFIEFMVERFLATTERDYESYIKNNIEELKKEFCEKEEKLENLYNRASNTNYKNNESNVVIVEHAIIVGLRDDILKYLEDENKYLVEISNDQNECNETIIRNNELVIEEIKNDIKENRIIGIRWDNEYAVYNLMEVGEMIGRLEDILEEQEEEHEEEHEEESI